MRRVAGIVNSGYAYEKGAFGQGITVAVVDSGVSMHRDLMKPLRYNNKIYNPRGRLVAWTDKVNGRNYFYDDNGHGTHVAGIIGGYGGGTNGFAGIAPACKFVGIKVLDVRGNGRLQNVLAGLQWILDNRDRYNIRIVNISVGTSVDKKCDEESVLVKKVDELWDSGLIVLAAAGNNGPEPGSIGAPGISRKIITVGAYDEKSAANRNYMDQSEKQSDHHNRSDQNKYNYLPQDYSGRGPTTACVIKPDIVAPGSSILSCNNRRGRYSGYSVKSGTSMSTPVVSGAIAVLLSYNDMISDNKLTNKDVKILLKDTARDLGFPHDRQGWGLIDIRALLEAI